MIDKRNWVYDIECYPNFFSNTFIDLASDETRVFVISEEKNELTEMLTFIQTECEWLIGYNSSKYDDVVLRYLFVNFAELAELGPNRITQQIFELGKDIISTQNDGLALWKNSKIKKYLKDTYFKSMDLMSMMAFDKNMISLKKVAVSMQWHKIQDLPKPFDEFVEVSEIDLILSYNKNDVEITKKLAVEQKDEIILRQQLSSMYKINLMSDSRSRIADRLMVSFWEKASLKSYSEFKDLRTTYNQIKLKNCISPKVGFKTSKLKKLLEDIKSTVYMPGDKFAHRVHINNTHYDVLLGGLHSVKHPEIFTETSEYELVDLDVNVAAS